MQTNMQRITPALSPKRAGRREAARPEYDLGLIDEKPDARGEQGAAEETREGAPTKR